MSEFIFDRDVELIHQADEKPPVDLAWVSDESIEAAMRDE